MKDFRTLTVWKKSTLFDAGNLSVDHRFPARGIVRPDQSDAPLQCVYRCQHR